MGVGGDSVQTAANWVSLDEAAKGPLRLVVRLVRVKMADSRGVKNIIVGRAAS